MRTTTRFLSKRFAKLRFLSRKCEKGTKFFFKHATFLPATILTSYTHQNRVPVARETKFISLIILYKKFRVHDDCEGDILYLDNACEIQQKKNVFFLDRPSPQDVTVKPLCGRTYRVHRIRST